MATIILDYDGTLHDTAHLYGCAVRKAYNFLCDNGQATPHYYSDEDVSIYLGMNAHDMWESFMPDLAQEWKSRASAMIGEEMVLSIKSHEAKLYDNAIEVLKNLKSRGHKLVFLSNCKRAYMKAHTEEFGLDSVFDGFYCCEDYDFAPKAEIFTYIQKDFDGPYIAVGDRAGDINLPADFKIGCLYGFGTPDELSCADALINSVDELLTIPELN